MHPIVEDYQKFLSPQTLAKLNGLQVRAHRIVEGYVSGSHRSPYHGFSIEFAEHRQYSPGDDLRYVDWKVFGKTDKFYLKQYEEETNLICYLVLDTSESMQYKGHDSALSKLEYAQRIVAAISYLVIKQQDNVGLITFDESIRQSVRPGGTASHWKELLGVMQQSEAHRKTATGAIFHELAGRLKKRGLIIVLSDLFDDVGPMIAGLKHLRHRRHDVVVMQTLDADELDFPFRQTTMFQGLEGMADVLADPVSLRKAYLQQFNEFQQSVRRGCRECGLDYVLMRTDRPLDVALSSYLAARMAVN